MPNYSDNYVPLRSPDKVSIGKVATNAQERLAALQSTLANDWAGLDIGRLERSDTASFHGWLMWPYLSTA